ncbi:hypothetical protein R3P38DRAFT_2796940 [Favolaschia claudopus]|uniref:BTB domain-containing protein n=1 Tax=Favolaschia claudopus TaxID=2862362 RepID=A0AAW0A516_9AGAR
MAQAVRDPGCYFEDGNIVLSAHSESQNRDILFRLHRSVLANHSVVFGDMFSMPPPATVPQYDGTPLVTMAGDDADVLRELVRFLYDSDYFSTVLNADDFPLKLLEPCKLANKYQIDWIPRKAAERLTKSWPNTVGGWLGISEEERTRLSRQIEMDVVGADASEPHWDDHAFQPRQLPEPVSSILLARECDAVGVLPLAFLDLLQRLPEPHPLNQYAEYAKKVEIQLLPANDWPRLLHARERMGSWFAEYSYPPSIVSHSKATACAGEGTRCEAAIYRTWLGLANSLASSGNILQVSSSSLVRSSDRLGICSDCKHKLEREIIAVQGAFLKSLDYFFATP